MPLDITPISQLTVASDPCKIKVRIVRLWGFPRKDKPEEFSGIDLLLVDEKGSRIQASVKGKLLSKFEKDLKEGDCCVLMNFELCPNLGKFRISDHPCKINFIFYTCVKPSEQIPNLEASFNLCTFPEILARRNDDTIFIDIIGEIVGINDVKNITTAEGPTKLLNLQLKDLGDSLIDVALWGKVAEDVFSNVKSQPSGPVIFLGSLMKSLLYQGGDEVSQSLTFYFQVKAPLKVLNLQQKFISIFLSQRFFSFKKHKLCKEEPRTSITEIKSSNSIQISKQSFFLSEIKTIIDLMGSYQDKSCNILASISLGPKISWFYIGCTVCFTKVTKYFNPQTEEIEPDKYSCEKCGKQITTTQPRFKLHIKATDNTGSTSFILFDDVVIPLIKKSAYELLEQQVQFDRSGETPQELLDLEGRKYVFKIMFNDAAKYNQSPTYRVISLTDVPDIIQSFSECSSTLNAIEPEIITVSESSVGPSIGTSTQGENIFSMVINIDNDVDNGSNVSTPTSTKKRLLPASEDVQQSSTKSKLIDNYSDDASNVSMPTTTTTKSFSASKDVQQSSTKPKLLSKAQIKKEKK